MQPRQAPQLASAHLWPVRVYIEDTDAGGIVYYVNYLKYMERARTEYLRTLGWDHQSLMQSFQSHFVVHQVQIQYQSPVGMDQQLWVRTQVASASKVRIRFQQTIYLADPTWDADLVQASSESELAAYRVCQARIDVAYVNATKRKPTAMPAPLVKALGECIQKGDEGE